MIDFISIEKETADNAKFYKGKLFEDFVCKLLKSLGYTDIEGRVKQNGLEYDFKASHALNGIYLVGEAKAWKKKVDGQVITSFSGKMIPFWQKQENTLGLFITTSELTPDAEDYLRSIKGSNNLQVISSSNIFGYLKKHLLLPTFDEISEFTRSESNLIPSKTRLVVSDKGEFYIQFLSTSDKIFASHYCILDKNYNFKNDVDLNKVLSRKWTELNEIEFLPSIKKKVSIQASKPIYKIEKSKILYSDWYFDYKLPVSPEDFIGRQDLLGKFEQFIKDRGVKHNQLIYQIVSRSGVGKSSALVKISDSYKNENIVITKDVREIKSKLDFEYFLQQIIAETNVAFDLKCQDFNRKYIESIDGKLLETQKKLFIFLDQFESLFFHEEIYDSFLDLFKECFQLTKNVIFVIARKNDQPTTFDEKAMIDLKTLESLSCIYTLKDFTKSEASQIFRRLQEFTKTKVNKQILESILEFSRGFPWLLKRVCAHLIKQLDSGVNLGAIAKSSLNLTDLFNEELNELNEDEKDFLLRIARYLPASISELDILFEEKRNLYFLLQRLQEKRLIRLSGNRYDTYNDVFKEYLVNGKISDFNISYLLRRSLPASLKILKEIIEKKSINIPNFIKEKGWSEKTFFNGVKEIRQLKLVIYDSRLGLIIPTEECTNAYQNRNLASLVRTQLRKNALVSNIISIINERKEVSFDDIKKYIIENFPLIEANEQTWNFYAKNLIDWLQGAKFILEENGKYILPEKTSQEIALSLGNFDHLSTKKRRRSDFYNPSERINSLVRVLGEIKNGLNSGSRVLNEALILKFAENSKGKIVLTALGVRFLNEKDFRKKFIIDLFLTIKELKGFLEYLYKSEDNALVKNVYEDYAKNYGWTKSTLDWKAKIITNWCDEAGIGIRISVKKLIPNKEVIRDILKK